MLNINPTNNYSKSNINFKSQKDYSKIYKEMEKITLDQEEKIIPKKKEVKLNKNIKFPKVKLMKINGKFLKDIDFLSVGVFSITIIALATLIGFFKVLHDDKQQDEQLNTKTENNNSNDLKSNTSAFKNVDSLYNLYKNNTITFDKFQEELDKLNKNK